MAPAGKAAAVEATTDANGFTFVVEHDLRPSGPYSYGKNTKRLSEPEPSDSLKAAWEKVGGTVEAMSPAPPGTVAVFTKQNLFAKAVHAAFFDHHPLVLSPDIIWLTIAQGLANHVDQNAEALRDQFVSHEGKKELVIERPEFVKGSPLNDWVGVFPEFSALIAANSVQGTVELIQNDFSTTGVVERVVSHITLMDAVQHYFKYTMCCGCGFPSITLTGTPADWEKIRAKAEVLRKYDLDWWLAGLLPALDQFVVAAHGKPDLDFWRSLCMINTGTSVPCFEPLTGWVQVFFPYLIDPRSDMSSAKQQLARNTRIANYVESYQKKINVANFGKERRDNGRSQAEGTGHGVKLELFPPAMSSAPFTYKDQMTGRSHKMAFFGGVTCLVQHASGAIEPKMGWAVMDSGRLSASPASAGENGAAGA
eukprot:gnl/TRDRNA2_/TRDRNA2_179819_c0_seq1.p1 gnl/TRDRNA2_/TRDRNA2_179819_c0~~gnl/TRDRNA2_/TRDRNA2_179819_c0_seq1.p1  ORF type:complete len:423 (+),score=73.58 gnl/TRDRNA2_/TRDRNA2_179819_c0_seq1:51-1319(+)